MVRTEYLYIVCDQRGRPRIKEGPLVATVVFMSLGGDSLEDIAAAYTSISKEAIREALDYYSNHKAEIDAVIDVMQKPPRGYNIGPNDILEKR